ncbi:hypothetical protein AB0O42_20105 [Streptomyces sp. NPDC089922]|uniref:hypothetical protein n=1 Tax=Streptomyces sp. NPDC089922 TaxID=3155189 RepID=UPI00342453D5
MENDMRSAAMWSGIISDADYVGRYIRDLRSCPNEGLSSALAFCATPYFSLAMYESLQKMQALDSRILAALDPDVVAIATRSRHSLKLFEDTKRGIDGQLSYFRERVIASHSERFLGGMPSLIRFLGTDLGLGGYAGRIIMTSHSATFHVGFEPDKLLAKDSGSYILEVYRQYGLFFGGLGATLDDQGAETFVTSLDSQGFEPRNVHAIRYYRSVFNGQGTPDLNAMLTTFQAMLNFATLVVSSGVSRRRVDYTALKIGFLSLYQVLRSIQLLLDDPAYGLTSRSVDIANRIVGSEFARQVVTPGARGFRNTLMHYNLPPKIDISKIDLEVPFFGMVGASFPQHDVASFVQMLDQCGASTAALFEEWAENG